ncbi:4675_t:CDS:2 [Ambispora leptoticha]|uniref:4675_t:CDS:1 n=1 Tax=Ambispora leptoticha TaxID=144679 RepID=A0A9N9EIF0_9GLOM|nr:4675_t:CDS:2 [Ambispora leptoticha]
MVNEQEQIHNATLTQITNNQELQQENNADNTSSPNATSTLINVKLREQSVSNVISMQSAPGNVISVQSESGSQRLTSSKVTPTHPVYNKYRESQEQSNVISTSRQSSVTLDGDGDDDRQSIANENDENSESPKAIFTKDEVKTFRSYLISQRNADDIYEVVDEDEFDPKNGSSSVHDIINMDQFQDDESSDFFDDSDSQTIVSCATIVEDDSPSPERARKKTVSFHISQSDQATNNTSTSPPNSTISLQLNDSNGNILASSSKSVSYLLHVEIENVDSAFTSTLNIATPQNHPPIQTFNQVPSSKNGSYHRSKILIPPILKKSHGTQNKEFFINLTSIAEFLVDRKEVMQIVHITGCNLQIVREYFQNGRNIPNDKKKYFWTNDEDMELLKPNNFQSISTIKTTHGTK